MKRAERVFGGEKYRWVIFGACWIMVMVCLGFMSTSRSLYLAPVTESLHIPRSVYSLAEVFRYAATAIINFFFGKIIVWLHTRRMIALGFVSLILSAVCYSLADGAVLLCLAGTFLGIGLAGTTTARIGYVVEQWFDRKKGTVMGLILAANGFGGAAASQLLSPVTYNEMRGGWRKAYVITAILMAAVGILIVLLIRDRAEKAGSHPAQQAAEAENGPKEWAGLSLEEAKKTGYFWPALACTLLTGMMLQSLSGIASAHMKDSELDIRTVSLALSVFSLGIAFTKPLTGVIFDGIGLRRTMLICSGSGMAAAFLLGAMTDSPAMALTYSLFAAFAMPLETILLPLIALEMFGRKDYSRIMGIFASVSVTGYAFGSPILNLIYDLSGSYRKALFCLGVMMFLITITMQILIGKAEKKKCSYKNK